MRTACLRLVLAVALTGSLAAAGPLDDARVQFEQGLAAGQRGDLDSAAKAFGACLTIVERLIPNTTTHAACLHMLGQVHLDRDDLAAAEDYLQRALSIRERLDRDSLDVADSLNNLGIVAHRRGDLAAAERYWQRALAIAERRDPDSLDVAHSLHNLGLLANDRGDLAAAEHYSRRALIIQERLAANSLGLANSLGSLGNVAFERGDLAAAETYYRRALAIQEQVAPDSLDLANSLGSLGSVAGARGELAAAESYYRRALAIQERVSPDSLDLASSLNNLGVVALQRSNLAAAEDYHQRARAIQERLAPDSLDLARSLNNLGNVAFCRGDLTAADACYRRALAIRERLAPDSLDAARSHGNLGAVALEQGLPALARQRNLRALGIVEHHRRAVANAESRSLLTERVGGRHYQRLLRAEVALGNLPGAFNAVERSRGRALVEALVERDCDLSDAPRELVARQNQLDNERQMAYHELGRCDPQADRPRLDELRARIERLGLEQRELASAIRRASPKYAALAYPEPLDLPAAQAALDPGTLLLTYLVDETETFLFAISRDACHLHRLPIKQTDLRQRVQAYSRHAAGGRLRDLDVVATPGATPAPAAATSGRELYDLLLRPAQAAIDGAARLLICPDDVLHALPFAALVSHEDGDARRYLIEDRPVHTTVSMGVYTAARQARSEAADRQPWIGFGDPRYPTAPAVADDAVLRRGGPLTPLPGTLAEVNGSRALLGPAAVARVGAEATETAARTQAGHSRIVHFACHGLLDDVDPFGSALALTPDPTNDGLLRAYEILQAVRLEADLVVLSACRTGLGQRTRFEGVVGLTRAFIYAGTPSVVASLWNVSDESTTALMTAFYRHLQAGESKDQALRSAQLALLHDRQHPEWARPYHWAAFELVGDWR